MSDKEKTAFQRQVENSPQFKAIQHRANVAAAQKERERKAKYEGNAEVQRARSMSKDERHANAVDLMTKNIKIRNDAKAGRATSEESARREAIAVARKAGASGA